MKKNTLAEKPNTVYGLLSRYRAELMGIATLWVTFFHSPIVAPAWMPSFIAEPIEIIKALGYGGVDLFILVSGIGIYQSLSKNSVSTYIKNRFKRIYPIWCVFAIMVFAIAAIVLHKPYSFKEILGFFTLYGHWSPALGRQGNWYVYTIMLFYIIAPIPFFLLRDSKRKTLCCIIITMITVLGSTAFFSRDQFTYKHFLFAFTRLPLFIIGMYISAALKERVMKALDWIICIVGCVLGFGVIIWLLKNNTTPLGVYGMWFYPFILIAPTLSLLLTKLFSICERPFRHWHAVLRFLGKGSLEIFLISNYIFKRAIAHKITFSGWQAILFSLAALVAGILFHLAIKYATKGVTALWQKARAKQA